uniref:Uncharacterized protein n=1 Tax=Arundo donax TaxID=35708 RepID=A0A0A9CTY5_ARUDO
MVGVHSEIRGGLSEASLGLTTAQEAFNCSSFSTQSTAFEIRGNLSEKNIVGTVSSGPTERSLEFSPIRESSIFSSEQGNMSSEKLEVPKLVSSCSSVNNSKEAESTGEENAVHKSMNQRSPVIKSFQPSSPDAVPLMKTAQKMQLPPRHDGHKSRDMKEKQDVESGNEESHPAKKAKLEVQEHDMNLNGNSIVSSTHSHTTSSEKATVGDVSEFVPQHKSVPDIMSIVEGEDYRRDPGRE